MSKRLSVRLNVETKNEICEDTAYFGRVAQLLESLADQGRLLVVMYLIDGGRSTKELQALLGISESDLLSQLEQLQATGIVQTRAVEHGSIHVSIDDKGRRFVVQLIDLV